MKVKFEMGEGGPIRFAVLIEEGIPWPRRACFEGRHWTKERMFENLKRDYPNLTIDEQSE